MMQSRWQSKGERRFALAGLLKCIEVGDVIATGANGGVGDNDFVDQKHFNVVVDWIEANYRTRHAQLGCQP